MTRLRIEGVPAQVDLEAVRPGQVFVVVDVHPTNRSIDISDEVDAGLDMVQGYHVMTQDGNRTFLADSQIDGSEEGDGMLIVHSDGKAHLALARTGGSMALAVTDEPPRQKRKYTRRARPSQEETDAPVE